MEDKSRQIQDMFDNIAPKYDFLNRLLSFRRDTVWRKEAIKAAEIAPQMAVLDLACGTGDVTAEIKKQIPEAIVTAGDFSVNMLLLAKKKLPDTRFTAADAHFLPFKDGSFDRLTIAFGFRNVMDKSKGLSEFYRVIKTGGKACILEFSEPENKIFGAVYKFYFKRILPFIGGIVSGNRKAYAYLPDSVYKFPKRTEYSKMISDAGFKSVKFKNLMFGAVTIAILDK